MTKLPLKFSALIMGLLVAISHGAHANECPECKKIEKGVSTTVENTGKALKSVGEDIGKGLDKMFGWMFKPQK